MRGKLAVPFAVAAVIAGALVAAPAHADGTSFGLRSSLNTGLFMPSSVVSPDGAHVFSIGYANDEEFSAKLSVTDTATGAAKVLSFGSADSTAIAVSADGAHVYVGADVINYNTGTDAYYIDAYSTAALVSATAGTNPAHTQIALGTTQPTTLAIASSGGADTVFWAGSDVNGNSVIGAYANTAAAPAVYAKKWQHATSGVVNGIAAAPDGSAAYVAAGRDDDLDGGSLSFVNGASGVAQTAALDHSPAGVAVSADGSRVYVAAVALDVNDPDSAASSLLAFDPATQAQVTAGPAVKGIFTGLAISPTDGTLYAPVVGDYSAASSTLDSFDAATLTATELGTIHDLVWSLAVAPGGDTIYASGEDGIIGAYGQGETFSTVPAKAAFAGPVKVGVPLTAPASLTDPTAWGPVTPTLSYEWWEEGSPIPGATSATYTPTADDWQSVIAVKVIATAPGYLQSSVQTPSALVATGTLTTATPKITGTAQVGQTLKVTPGTWTRGTTFSYRWYANGGAIAGATKSTLTIPGSLYGKKITVRVSGSADGYASAGVTSAATAAVTAGTLKTATPTIAGTIKAGKTVTARPGTWTSGTKFAYQWNLDGKKISGATRSTLALKSTWGGHRVSVTVTGSATGYKTAAKASATKTIAK